VHGPASIWDDGYPSGGNYWSDYNGTDFHWGPDQSKMGSDGIGDTQYVIDEYIVVNQDNYPLVHPYGSIRNLDTNLTYLTIQSAINTPETLNGHAIFVRAGTYYENVVVNKTLAIIGEGASATFVEGRKVEGTTVSVEANDVTIMGFTIINEYPGSYRPGIFIDRVQSCIITENIVKNAGHAIWLVDSHEITISKNTIVNSSYGVRLFGSNRNTITENIIAQNWAGVWLYDSFDNTIFHNNFINNTKEALIDNSYDNVWDDGYPSGGNYWRAYNPPDEDLDKTGDAPYVIDENNVDRYPLIYPCGFVPKADVNDDGTVNIRDLFTVARAFGSIPGEPDWNPTADVEMDEVIGIRDLYKIAKDYGKTLIANWTILD